MMRLDGTEWLGVCDGVLCRIQIMDWASILPSDSEDAYQMHFLFSHCEGCAGILDFSLAADYLKRSVHLR